MNELFNNEDINIELLDDNWFMTHALVNDCGEWKIVEVKENAEKELG